MSETQVLSVLISPAGQLSGDGQLRESIKERRSRKGEDFPLWHLPPALVVKFGLAELDFEAVVAADPLVITWLHMRFGGEVCTAQFDVEILRNEAGALPPAAPLADLGIDSPA